MVRFAMACALLLMPAGQAVAQVTLSRTDQAAAFRAAGFLLKPGEWRNCEDPGSASYSPGEIETLRDLNGDGRPEAIITEGSTFCYGNTGVGYRLVSKQADGTWRLIASGSGMVRVLVTEGAGGWPDLEIGGPGFCHPVQRWDGREYVLTRHQYEGKSCQPR